MPVRFASRSWGLLLVVTATACWSTSGLFINILVKQTHVSPAGLAFWRDLSVAMCLVVALAIFQPHQLRVARQDIPWLAGMGIFGIGLFHFCWNTSVLRNGAALSTIIQSNGPILVAFGAWFLWREPLTTRKLGAIGLTLIGTLLIAGLSGNNHLQMSPIDLLIAMGVPIFYGTFSLLGKKVAGTYSPWTVLTYVFLFGTFALAPFQIGQPLPGSMPVVAMAAFAGLVLLTTILGYSLYTAGLRRLQASVATIVATTEVLFASVLAYSLLGERLDLTQIIGALLIVSAVILLSWRRGRMRSAWPAGQHSG